MNIKHFIHHYVKCKCVSGHSLYYKMLQKFNKTVFFKQDDRISGYVQLKFIVFAIILSFAVILLYIKCCY